MSLVACRACKSYDHLAPILEQAILDLGGWESFVQPGQRVFCKVNLLLPAIPERGITTHPEMLRAVIRAIKARGAVAVVGDNPAMPPLSAALRRSGLAAVIAEEGAELADMRAVTRIGSVRAIRYHSFEVSEAIIRADLLINLPKLKAHALTGLTLAQKNLFGFIPGLEKSRYHMRGHTPEEFSTLLVDLHEAVREAFPAPRLLHILDGVLGLEGDGPGNGGTPKPIGVILASQDAVSLDRVACEIVRMDPARVVHLAMATARGTGEGDPSRIRVLGESPQQVAIADFLPPPSSKFTSSTLPRPLRLPFLRGMAIERPVISERVCVRCLKCVDICASRAITASPPLREGQGRPGRRSPPPHIDLDRCIRCYCCSEICPEGAIHKSDPPLAGRLMSFLR